MPAGKWDYSPLRTCELAIDLVHTKGIIAQCECGEKFTAVSGNEKECDKIILAKYRKHARKNPETHPIPKRIKRRVEMDFNVGEMIFFLAAFDKNAPVIIHPENAVAYRITHVEMEGGKVVIKASPMHD